MNDKVEIQTIPTTAAAIVPGGDSLLSSPSSSNCISFLGDNHDEAMCVVSPPSTSDNKVVLDLLKKIEIMLQKQSTIDYMKDVVSERRGKTAAAAATTTTTKRSLKNKEQKQQQGNCDLADLYNGSIRMIQAGRYEIFLKSQKYKPTGWFQLLKQELPLLLGSEPSNMSPEEITDTLISYAMERARLDPRLQRQEEQGQQWKFNEFSLIVSYDEEESQQQEPHVDVEKPNYQFGMMVTNNSPSTIYYEVPQTKRIQCAQDLIKHWKTIDDTMPEFLESTMENDLDLHDKLKKYGAVFNVTNNENDDGDIYFRHAQDRVSAGTVLSLPGEQVHAGPASKSGFRSIMFFTATPYSTNDDGPTKAVVMYDPDIQYSNVLLVGAIIQILWRRYNMDKESRVYLLKRLKDYLQMTTLSGTPKNSVHWFEHFDDMANFKGMLKKMEQRILKEEKGRSCDLRWTWDKFFEKHANKDDLLPFHFQTAEYIGEFKLCSHTNLHTIDDDSGKAYRTNVYYREVDDRIFLFCYLPDKAGLTTGNSFYEGTDRDDKYKLMWIDGNGKKQSWKLAQEQQIVFDGTNGQLFDSEHEPFAAFLREEKVNDNPKQDDPSSTGLDRTEPEAAFPSAGSNSTKPEAVPSTVTSTGLDSSLHQILCKPKENESTTPESFPSVGSDSTKPEAVPSNVASSGSDSLGQISGEQSEKQGPSKKMKTLLITA